MFKRFFDWLLGCFKQEDDWDKEECDYCSGIGSIKIYWKRRSRPWTMEECPKCGGNGYV